MITLPTALSRRQLLLSMVGAWFGGTGRATPVAFHYQAYFSGRAVKWYSRFPVLVTGAILDPRTSDRLRARGTRLVAYEWLSAFYGGDEVSAPAEWREEARRNRGWLLNEEPVGGGAALGGKSAYWYDFGNPELRERRAGYLARRLAESGYDGLFLDTLGFSQLPGPVRKVYADRHPAGDFDGDQGAFLKILRRRLGNGKILFTNQGYRNPGAFLDSADYDLSESYFTARAPGATLFRPWYDEKRPWESVRTPMERLVVPAARDYPKVRFVHLNYAAGPPQMIARARRYSFACAALFLQTAYVVAPEPAAEEDEIYFSNLGRPVGDSYEERPETGIAWREFERAVVAVNSSHGSARIPGLALRMPGGPEGCVFRKQVTRSDRRMRP